MIRIRSSVAASALALAAVLAMMGVDRHAVAHGGEDHGAPANPPSAAALDPNTALVPIALSKGQPGKEILQPVAVVILGGLLSSTLLDIVVTPAVFLKFGRASAERLSRGAASRRRALSPSLAAMIT